MSKADRTDATNLSPVKLALLEKRLGRLRAAGAGESKATPTPAPGARAEGVRVRASYSQDNVWALAQAEGYFSAYSFAVHLEGDFDARALESALGELVRRHESLRTNFVTEGTELFQTLRAYADVRLPVSELMELPPARRAEEVSARLAELSREPFDPSRGELFRARLLKLSDGEHVLLFSILHLVCDRWSLGVLTRELTVLYNAFAEGRPSPLPEPEMQYTDYAAAQRRGDGGAVFESHRAYWRRQLADCPVALPLPASRVRPPVQTFRGGRERFAFPPEVAAGLRALCQEEGATLYMGTLAAFVLLLHRYTGGRDIPVGTAVAGRHTAAEEKLLGSFLNPLLLRVTFSGDPSFRELLRRVRAVTLEAFSHQDFPLQNLVGELRPHRDPSLPALAQVGHMLHHLPPAREGGRPSGVRMRLEVIDTGRTALDLLLRVEDAQPALAGILEYNADVFEPAMAAGLCAHYLNLLGDAVSDPERRLSRLTLLGESERLRLLGWLRGERTTVAARRVHELFEARAAHAPSRVALAAGDAALTYGELEERARSVASLLRAAALTPQTRVAVLSNEPAERLVGALAALKAGAAYVPVAADGAPELRRQVLRETGATVLLTSRRLPAPASSESERVVYVEDAPGAAGREASAGVAAHGADSESSAGLAYVNHEGRGNAVEIEHEGLLNFAVWYARTCALTPADRVACDPSAPRSLREAQAWAALAAGSCVVEAPPGLGREPAAWQAWLSQSGVTVCFVGAPLAAALVREEWPERTNLRVLLAGGERLTRPPSARFPFSVVACYTLSAYTAVAAYYVLPTEVADGSLCAGCPIDNTHIYVLDRAGEPVPPGVAGELYVGGAGLARGFASPGLTAERFVPDPFSPELGACLFRTGEAARLLPGGSFEPLGLAPAFVNVRGFAVALAQVEDALASHPAVFNAAVVGRGRGDGATLAAYVVTRAGAYVDAGELREFLGPRLPRYMTPDEIVLVDELPTTPDGRADREALARTNQATERG